MTRFASLATRTGRSLRWIGGGLVADALAGWGIAGAVSGRQTDYLGASISWVDLKCGHRDARSRWSVKHSSRPICGIVFVGRTKEFPQCRSDKDQRIEAFMVPELGKIKPNRPGNLMTPIFDAVRQKIDPA